MNLYLLSQEQNNDWDTYDSCVVVANSPEEARLIRPDGSNWEGNLKYKGWAFSPDKVTVSLIGTAIDQEIGSVVIASFNAG
jgi:hypothetical protein